MAQHSRATASTYGPAYVLRTIDCLARSRRVCTVVNHKPFVSLADLGGLQENWKILRSPAVEKGFLSSASSGKKVVKDSSLASHAVLDCFTIDCFTRVEES